MDPPMGPPLAPPMDPPMDPPLNPPMDPSISADSPDSASETTSASATEGGARRRQRRETRRHIVVDTLNILHVLGKRPSAKAIVETIDAVAPVLRKGDSGAGGFPGRIMFVVKDRETEHLDEATHAAYAEAAVRNRAYVYAVERYRIPPCVSAVNEPGARTAATRSPRHSVRSRDDFYAAVLAERWSAPVLTADRFRDFAEWRRTLAPFHVDEYTFSAGPDTPPLRYFVNPKGGGFERMKAPDSVRPCRAISSLLPVKCVTGRAA